MAEGKGFGFTVYLVNQTPKVFSQTLKAAAAFGKQFGKVATAPIKAAFSPQMMAGVFNIKAAGQAMARMAGSIDGMASQAAQLKVVDASFKSMTKTFGSGADNLAKQLQGAALGMITLGRAKEIANRALASGMDTKQLQTAMEFISKKSVTTGANAGEAMQTVITGLSRGSTLFLDDFGILVDGTDAVKRNFDKIKGAGAFDALGPAAQKAEIVRAAIAEMNGQMGKIGVRGDELAFTMGRLKVSFEEMTTKAFSAALPFIDAWTASVEKGAKRIGATIEHLADFANNNYAGLKKMMATGLGGTERMAGGAWAGMGKMLGGDSTKLAGSIARVVAKIPAYISIAVRHIQRGALVIGQTFTDVFASVQYAMAQAFYAAGEFTKNPQLKQVGAVFEGAWNKASLAAMAFSPKIRDIDEELIDLGIDLEQIDKAADKLTKNMTWATMKGGIADAGRAVRGMASDWWKANGPIAALDRFAEKSKQAGEAAKKSASKIWDAYRQAADAVEQAADKLKAAIGQKDDLGIRRREERLARGQMFAGDNERRKAELAFIEARKMLNMASGLKGDPERSARWREAGAGLMGGLANDPRVMGNKDMRAQVDEQMARVRALEDGFVAQAKKQAEDQFRAAEIEKENLRQKWAAQQREVNASDRVAKSGETVAAVFNSIQTAGKAMAAGMAAMAAGGGVGAALPAGAAAGFNGLAMRLGG